MLPYDIATYGQMLLTLRWPTLRRSDVGYWPRQGRGSYAALDVELIAATCHVADIAVIIATYDIIHDGTRCLSPFFAPYIYAIYAIKHMLYVAIIAMIY